MNDRLEGVGEASQPERDPKRMTRLERAEWDREIRARPATTGDIERLIQAVNNGWIGRGFAIGFGMAVLGFIAGLIFAVVWSSMMGAY